MIKDNRKRYRYRLNSKEILRNIDNCNSIEQKELLLILIEYKIPFDIINEFLYFDSRRKTKFLQCKNVDLTSQEKKTISDLIAIIKALSEDKILPTKDMTSFYYVIILEIRYLNLCKILNNRGRNG